MLLAAGLGLALPLAGCGIRLESDAPRVLGTPSPDPAGPAILAERERVAAILASATHGGSVAAAEPAPSPPGPLVAVHTQQVNALDAALAALDPPVTAPASSASPPAAQGSGTPTSNPAELADLEMAALDGPGLLALDELVPRAAGIVLASHTQRAVAANLLRAAGVRGIATIPDLPWVVADREIGLRLVDAVRPAAYGVEVQAARTDPTRRTPLLAALTRLRRIETALGERIDDLPPRPLGYPLPAEKNLADGVLRRLVDVTLSCATPTSIALQETEATPAPPAPSLRPTVSDPSASTGTAGAMATLARLAAEVESARLALGGSQVRALPGLGAEAPTESSSPMTAISVTGTTDPS